MNTLIQDLRYGARMLLRKPGFTLVAVLTLALGIGANTAVFSIVNRALLRPARYRDPDGLYTLWESFARRNRLQALVSVPNFRDWEERNQVFEELAAFTDSELNSRLSTRASIRATF